MDHHQGREGKEGKEGLGRALRQQKPRDTLEHHHHSMASACRLRLLLPLLAVVLVSAVEGREFHVIRHHILPSNDAAALCRHAEFPDLCISISKTLHSATPHSLTEAVVRAAMVKTVAAKAAVTKLMAEDGTSKMMKSYLQVCQQNFGSAVDSLQQAMGQLNGPQSYTEVMNQLSAALTFVETCSDGFDERPGLDCPITNVNTNLRKLVGNSLSLANVTLKRKSN